MRHSSGRKRTPAETAELPKEFSLKDLEKIDSDTFAVAFKCILHDCPSCGNPVPLNGPVRSTSCPTCLFEVKIPKDILDLMIDLDFGRAVTWTASPHTTETLELPSLGPITAQVERTSHPEAFCIACLSPLGVHRQAWQQPSLEVSCPSCELTNTFVECPEFLTESSVSVTHVAGLELESNIPADSAPKYSEAMKPVAISCPSCGGGLMITAESQRTTLCEYCGTSVYLPDDLWRQLHPVKKAECWEVVYQFTPRVLENATIQERQSLGCFLTILWALFSFAIIMFNLQPIAVLFQGPQIAWDSYWDSFWWMIGIGSALFLVPARSLPSSCS